MVLGAVLRLAFAVAGAEEPSYEPIPRDPGFYLVLGDQVADGDGYAYDISHDGGLTYSTEPTAYYPPGYPVSLGALFWLVDLLPGDVSHFGLAIAFNVVLATATIPLMFELGRRLAGEKVGLVAAGLLAVWPNLVMYSGAVLTETLFLFLLMLMFLVALPSEEAVARVPDPKRLAATGLLLGIVGLVRPTSLVLVPVFILLWWRPGRAELRTALQRTAVVGGAALLVILPWTARNLLRMDAPVLISTNFGDNFCMGHNPEATGAFASPFDHPCFDDLYEGERPRYETERQSETTRRAFRNIRDDPTRALTLVPAKARYTLGDDTDGLDAASDYGQVDILSSAWRGVIKVSSNTFYVVAMATALAGAIVLVRRGSLSRTEVFFVAAGLAQLVPPLVTFGDPRFKLPIYPAVAFLAAAAIVSVLEQARQDRAAPEPDTSDQSETMSPT
jgi:4-amino-4-deoxy-L-arabinose transferase-like glycosyltransferase